MMMIRLQRHLSSKSTLSHDDNSPSTVPLCRAVATHKHHISDHVTINHSPHNYFHRSISSTRSAVSTLNTFSYQFCDAFPRRLFAATPDLQAVFNYYKIIFHLMVLFGSQYDTIPTSLSLLSQHEQFCVYLCVFCVFLFHTA